MRGNSFNFLKRLVALNDTPERIAKAFALGVFLAFSPLLGLHTFVGLLLAFFLHLNRFALLLGVFVNNPWTLIPIYAAGAYLGGLLLGFPPRPPMPNFEWQALWSSSFWQQMSGQMPILKPMVLGSSILSIFASVLAYFMVLNLLKQNRAHLEKRG
jgi:uncharacterized protein (DUF2062 family)